MKLTTKDGVFLEQLRRLIDEKDLSVELIDDGYKRFVLRGNYGARIDREFQMTRQGVRWRFQRVFSEIYPQAYEAILFIESHFGTELRQMAMAIARERAELRKKALYQSAFDLVRGGRADG